MAAGALWSARHHLRDTWRGTADDAEEAMPYRLAWGVVLGGLAVLWYLLVQTGLTVAVAGLLLGVAMGLFLGTTLVLAQTGMGRMRAPHSAAGILAEVIGTANLGGNQMAALGLSYIWAGDIQLFTMGTGAMGLKVWHDVRPSRPRWAWPAGVTTILLCLVAACGAYLVFGYRYGAHGGFGWYFEGAPLTTWNWVASQIRGGTEASRSGWFLMALGGLLTLAVDTLHRRYFWWPLHPAGLAICQVNTTAVDWASMFLAWALKVTLLHYGGPRTFRTSLPLFLGLIAGACAGVSVSFLVSMLTA
jgi:hypothetical protein